MLIVEDGTGKVDSNSYVSVENADKYFTDRQNEQWLGLSTENKETALIKGTSFIDNVFQWKGKKKTQEQALAFPRTDLIDIDGFKVEGVPVKLMDAVCEASLISSTGKTLFTTSESNGNVVSEKIGELAFAYDTSSKVKDATLYQSINSLLRGLYYDKSGTRIGSAKVVRL